MDIKKYIYGHCVHPVSVRIWDAYSSQYIVRLLPCGKCLHCRNTRINEWCTRLFAQSKYSKYVYYITLDYAPFSFTPDVVDDTVKKLSVETAAVYHNLNYYHKYGVHPLLLKRNHLQDFLKRFRFNTGIKIQYFGCGEYGTHANGRGFGRPHFHLIIFSDVPITQQQFQDAWTLNGYKIGNVDYVDMRAVAMSDKDTNKIFKYVCKYLQKTDFDFEKLATIDFHRAYFDSLQYVMAKTDTLFPELVKITDSKTIEYNWSKYIQDYSPFICCSKRPAIGLQYFNENVERFKNADFRLFGLSQECTAFPTYFMRKTKEACCRFVCLGRISSKPSTCSRLDYIVKILREVQNSRIDIENFISENANAWHTSKCMNSKLLLNRITNNDLGGYIACSDLHLYDTIDNVMYQFNGYSYTLWRKYKNMYYTRIGDLDITDVILRIENEYKGVYDNLIKPFHDMRILNENELNDTISVLYKDDFNNGGLSSYEKFMNEVHARYKVELQNHYRDKLLASNSKIAF